jgi:hypothetical protein
MISPLLLLALAAPAHSSAPPPNPNVQRQAFTHCLVEMLASDLHAHTAVDAFKAKLDTICKVEAEAFRQASVRADIAVGIKAAAAQDNAVSEIKDIVETQSERYKSYFETNTTPK